MIRSIITLCKDFNSAVVCDVLQRRTNFSGWCEKKNEREIFQKLLRFLLWYYLSNLILQTTLILLAYLFIYTLKHRTFWKNRSFVYYNLFLFFESLSCWKHVYSKTNFNRINKITHISCWSWPKQEGMEFSERANTVQVLQRFERLKLEIISKYLFHF